MLCALLLISSPEYVVCTLADIVTRIFCEKQVETEEIFYIGQHLYTSSKCILLYTHHAHVLLK